VQKTERRVFELSSLMALLLPAHEALRDRISTHQPGEKKERSEECERQHQHKFSCLKAKDEKEEEEE
jgi:hypothetical protein